MPVPLSLLCPSARYTVSFLRGFQPGLFQCVQLVIVAARLQLPRPTGWHCSRHHIGPNMAAYLRALGTQA